MKAQKGMDSTRTSVNIVKKALEDMKAAVFIRCLIGIDWSQCEAIGTFTRRDARKAESVRMALMVLITCQIWLV